MDIKKETPAHGDDLKQAIETYMRGVDNPDFDPEHAATLLEQLAQANPAALDFDAATELAGLPIKTPPKRSRGMRFGAICVAAVLIASAITLAFDNNPFRFFTDTMIFHERRSGNLTLSDGTVGDYSSLQEAMSHYGITEALCPTWIPPDYTIAQVAVRSSEESVRLAADYSAERGNIRMQVTVCTGTDLIRAEEIVEGGYFYTHDGSTYYILPNTVTVKAYWHVGTYYCTISGNVTTDELEQMIDSIP